MLFFFFFASFNQYCIYYNIHVVVPEASKQLLNDIPGVKTLEITAKYPIAEGNSCDVDTYVGIHFL